MVGAERSPVRARFPLRGTGGGDARGTRCLLERSRGGRWSLAAAAYDDHLPSFGGCSRDCSGVRPCRPTTPRGRAWRKRSRFARLGPPLGRSSVPPLAITGARRSPGDLPGTLAPRGLAADVRGRRATPAGCCGHWPRRVTMVAHFGAWRILERGRPLPALGPDRGPVRRQPAAGTFVRRGSSPRSGPGPSAHAQLVRHQRRSFRGVVGSPTASRAGRHRGRRQWPGPAALRDQVERYAGELRESTSADRSSRTTSARVPSRRVNGLGWRSRCSACACALASSCAVGRRSCSRVAGSHQVVRGARHCRPSAGCLAHLARRAERRRPRIRLRRRSSRSALTPDTDVLPRRRQSMSGPRGGFRSPTD
jgi:hypothetical protein